LKAYPISRLAEKGSLHPPFAIYTQDDVRSVVTYAADRGIRVVPVLDVPGHTQSWKKGMPSIFPSCPSRPESEQNVLDPTNEDTFKTIAAVFDEMDSLFPDEWWGIEGDEVQCSCVLRDAEVVKWLHAHSPPFTINTTCDTFLDSFTNPTIHQLQSYLTGRVLNLAQGLPTPRNLLISQYLWDRRAPSVGPLNMDHQAFEYAYGGDSELFEPPTQPIDKGFRILDLKSFYFDLLSFESFAPDPTVAVYDADPQAAWNLTDAQAKLVMGGMASYWTAQFDDSTLDTFLWPRSSAMAERLWTARDVIPSPTAAKWDAYILPRLVQHRCRMLRRGVQPYSLATSYCVLPEPDAHE
jgi:hexosaminidase